MLVKLPRYRADFLFPRVGGKLHGLPLILRTRHTSGKLVPLLLPKIDISSAFLFHFGTFPNNPTLVQMFITFTTDSAFNQKGTREKTKEEEGQGLWFI